MARIRTLIERPDGSIAGVNADRANEMPFNLLTNPPRNAVAVAANSASDPVELTIGQGGPAELIAFAVERTGAAQVNFTIIDGEFEQWSRNLMNSGIHLDTIMGSGAQPYRLPESLVLGESRALTVTFTNLTAAPNNISMNCTSARYASVQKSKTMLSLRERLRRQQYLSLPYWYTTDQGPIVLAAFPGAGSTQQVPITIDRDMHFSCHTITAVSTNGPFNLDIVDCLTGASIIRAHQQPNYPISSGLIVGNGNFAFRFTEPRLFLAKTKLLVTLVNRSVIGPNTIFLTLGGTSQIIRPWA